MSCESLSAFRSEVLEFRRAMKSRRVMGSPCLRESLVADLMRLWLDLKLSHREHAQADASVRAAFEDFAVVTALVDSKSVFG